MHSQSCVIDKPSLSSSCAQSSVYRLLNAFTHIKLHQQIVTDIGRNTIAQKHVDKTIVGIDPGTSTRKACMAIDGSWSRLTTRAEALIGLARLIETQSPTADA